MMRTHENHFTNGYSDVNGLTMYYEIHGEGEPLVLIHGGGSTIGSTYGTVMPMLAKKCKIIAVELQAHGRTSDRNAPESFEQDADDVAMLMHNLAILKASFFGFSNGGNTVMQIGIRRPEIVNKLVIASAFYRRDGMMPGFFEGLQNATIDVMPKVLIDAFLKVNADSKKLQTMFEKDRDRMIGFTDWTDEMISSIKAPALIISGDQDVMVPAHAAALSKLIDGSRLLILPATHGSYLGVTENPGSDGKQPQFIVDAITHFLNGK